MRVFFYEELFRDLGFGLLDSGSLLNCLDERFDFSEVVRYMNAENSLIDYPSLKPRVQKDICEPKGVSKNKRTQNLFIHNS